MKILNRFVGKLKDLTSHLIESHLVAEIDQNGKLVRKVDFPKYLKKKDKYVAILSESRYQVVKSEGHNVGVKLKYDAKFYRMFRSQSYQSEGYQLISQNQYHTIYSGVVNDNNLSLNSNLKIN